jgi:DNA phosphorothioation-dependent restriction protein DptG
MAKEHMSISYFINNFHITLNNVLLYNFLYIMHMNMALYWRKQYNARINRGNRKLVAMRQAPDRRSVNETLPTEQ